MRIVTHNGSFHADEVFAVAALKLKFKNENVEIIRTRDPKILATADLVVDVGALYDGERFFDHHQGGIEPRSNGVPYASFGLVWKRFGAEICDSEEIAKRIETELILHIDAADNSVEVYKPIIPGVYPYILHDIVHSFYPLWDDTTLDYDSGFEQALGFATIVLDREMAQIGAVFRARPIFKKFYESAHNKKIILLDRKCSYEEFLPEYPEILFVISPNQADDPWHVKTARDSIYSFENRKSFPESWAGKRGNELVLATGVSDAIFCHRGRFLTVAGSKEGALALAELATKEK